MWNATGLAISVPAAELDGVKLPGSLFKREDLLAAKLSQELSESIELIVRSLEIGRPTPVFVARPEMFTDGQSLAWLRARLGPIQDHICISDGSAVRVIPEMRNHVFFHGLGRRTDSAALGRLERRVPELFSTVASQINTAFRFRDEKKTYTPPPIVITSSGVAQSEIAEYYRFYLNPFSIEDSVGRILQKGEVNAPDRSFSSLTYIAVTEASLDDKAFSKTAALHVARAFFDPTRAVIIRLPRGDALARRIETTLFSMRHTSVLIPGVTASNVFFVTEDPVLSALASISQTLELLTHDTFDFWRHSPGFYAAFGALRVVVRGGRHNPAKLPGLLADLCGRRPELIWPAQIARRDRS